MHREEQRAGLLGRGRGRAPLVAQDLVDVGGVAVVVGEREPADVAVALLDLLEAERDLVEVAEDELVARDLDVEVGAAVEDLLLPAHRLGLAHARGDAVDADLVAALLLAAERDQRGDEREQAVARGALGREDPPALGLEVVGVAALVPEVIGLGRRGAVRALAARRPVGEPVGQDRRTLVGVDHQQVEVGGVGGHPPSDWRRPRA